MDPFHPSQLHSISLVQHTLSFLPAGYVLHQVAGVSKSWLGYTKSDIVWSLFCQSNFGLTTKLAPICEHISFMAGIPPCTRAGVVSTQPSSPTHPTAAGPAVDHATPTKLLCPVPTFLTTWICWERLHRRVNAHRRVSVQGRLVLLSGVEDTGHILRAAATWEIVLAWNAIHLPHLIKDTTSPQCRSPQLNLGVHWDQASLVAYAGSVCPTVTAFFACTFLILIFQ